MHAYEHHETIGALTLHSALQIFDQSCPAEDEVVETVIEFAGGNE